MWMDSAVRYRSNRDFLKSHVRLRPSFESAWVSMTKQDSTNISTETGQIANGLSLPVYEHRDSLYEELHSRPSPLITTPCYVTHIALMRGDHSPEEEYERILTLCKRFSVNPPEESASCFYQGFGGFEFRWERHTEFSTYTFIRPDDGQKADEFGLAFLPKDWLNQLPGKVAIALNMIVQSEGGSDVDENHFFECQRPLGSMVANRKAKVLTTFRLHSDGFARFFVQNLGLNPYQTGRLVHRLLELETYRVMALAGLPVARGLSADLAQMENQLASLNQAIAGIHSEADEPLMLKEISVLAAKIEQIRSDTNYRFAATKAYYDLVKSRLDQVYEQKLSGVQTMREFLERRLAPGIKTCEAARIRLEDLSRRLHRASSLLRTRVELSIESQNQKLLSSMDRRSSLQLRLQQTVEGLSVVAIGYYLMGLLSYVFEGLAEWGHPINKSLASGIAMPIVIVLVFMAVRSVRKHITKQDKSGVGSSE